MRGLFVLCLRSGPHQRAQTERLSENMTNRIERGTVKNARGEIAAQNRARSAAQMVPIAKKQFWGRAAERGLSFSLFSAPEIRRTKDAYERKGSCKSLPFRPLCFFGFPSARTHRPGFAPTRPRPSQAAPSTQRDPKLLGALCVGTHRKRDLGHCLKFERFHLWAQRICTRRNPGAGPYCDQTGLTFCNPYRFGDSIEGQIYA